MQVQINDRKRSSVYSHEILIIYIYIYIYIYIK